MRGLKPAMLRVLSHPRTPSDLVITLVVATLSLMAVLALPAGNPVRVGLALVLVFLLPGYACVALFWPAKEKLSHSTRLALSFGLSMMTTGIAALVFVAASVAIEASIVALILFFVTVVLTGIAWRRRLELPEADRYVLLTSESGAEKWNLQDKLVGVAILSGVLVSLAILLVLVSQSIQGETYTSFYILGEDGSVDSLPANLRTGEGARILIGIDNHEGREVLYSVEVTVRNETGNATMEPWRSQLLLGGGDTASIPFDFSLSTNGTYEIEFALFRDSEETSIADVYVRNVRVQDG